MRTNKIRVMAISAAVLAMAAGNAVAQCITSGPTSQNACPGQTVQFRVTSGSVGAKFQWFRNGSPIAGATSSTLTIPNVQAGLAGQYTVQVKDGLLFCNTISAPATLNVYSTPVITSQPVSDAGELGGTASFSVGVSSGTTPSQVTWRRDGVQIPGATGPSLTLSNIGYMDIGSTVQAVVAWPCGSVTSQAATILAPTDPASVEYYRFVRGIAATEVVRSNFARNYTPVLAVTVAAVAEVAARNPNATQAQLEQFAAAYKTALRAKFADDPDLKRGFNLQTAVAFTTPVTIAGVDTNVGEAVLARLGMDHNAPNRTLQMIAFQGSLSYRFATSDHMATLLGNVFADRDAAGVSNASVQGAVASVLRGDGIEPYPTTAQLRQNYPEVARGIALIPTGRAAFLAEQAAGFPNMRAALNAEYAALKTFIDNEIDDLKIYKQQYPTLESTYNAAKNQAVVSAALANRTADLVQLNQSRAGISFATAVMAKDTQNGGAQIALERQFANLNVDMASAASDSLSTALQGASVIISAGAQAAEGPLGMVGAVSTLLGGVADLLPEVFPQDNGPSPLQMVSDQITDLADQVDQIRVEMNDRFNRIDSQLTTISSAIDSGFAAMVGYFNGVNSSLESLQTQVATAQTNLNRLEQNLYGVLSDGFNFPFITAMDTYLNYRDRNNQDIARADYIAAEGSFYSAATNQALSQTYSGPNALSLAYDASAVDQLNNFPLGYNINNLRLFPATYLGLTSVFPQRVANPMSWSLNADAYAQLGRENPWYMAQTVTGDPSRLNTVLQNGKDIQSMMSACRSGTLMNVLRTDHTARAGTLQSNLDAALGTFMTSKGLSGSTFSLWGGSDQAAPEVAGNFQYPAFNTRILRYGDQCNATTVSLASTTIPPHNGTKTAWSIVPNPVFQAAFLGLPQRSLANYFWTFRFNGEASPGGGTGWQLVGTSGTKLAATVDVELWWSPNHGTTTPLQGGGSVMRLGCGGALPGDQLIVTRRYNFTVGPADIGVDASSLFRTFFNRWAGSYSVGGSAIAPINTIFTTGATSPDTSFEWGNTPVWTAQTIVDPTGLAAVKAAVDDKLRALQAEYYSVLATPLSGGAENSNVKSAADQMTVPVLLMDSYLSLGAPESFAQSDVLRGMFRGNELRMDRDGAFNFFNAERARVLAMAAGSAAPTTKPSWSAEVARRWTLLGDELTAATAGTRIERYPFMNWTIANLEHMKVNARRLAADDTYVATPGQTLVVPASAGVLANDVTPPRDGITPRFSPTAILDVAPSVGSLSLSGNGGFSYTPPAGFTGEVTFKYHARGDIQSGSQNLVDTLQASVVIRVADCAPVITSQPEDQALTIGSMVGFGVGVQTSGGRVTYQWRKNGTPMSDNARISGTDGPNLVVSNLTELDRATYDVVITSGCGTVTSRAAGLGYCVADVNYDGSADLGDFFDFLAAFDTGAPLADLDRDGIVDLVDFFDFLNRFDTPC